MRILLALFLTASLATSVSAADWTHLRGPGLDGKVTGSGLFDEGTPALELAWRVPLGSGYSGIAVAGGKVVTLFTRGDEDWIGAFGLVDGKELWRRSLGPKNPGHDGSDDGPISSPVIGHGAVFALTPAGDLVAVELSTGEVRWQRLLVEEFGAKPPPFGFGTTPLLEGDLLVVQAGGSEGRSLLAFDARSGEQRWATREDPVGYQSPYAMDLAGRRQIVAAVGRGLAGLDPASGEPLWTHELAEGEDVSSAHPTPAGKDRFLLFLGGDAAVFQVSSEEGGFRVQELFRSKALGQSYAPPVLHEGYLYGFRGRILSCMDAATGEQKWRSRAPGGDGLLLVDGHLLIFASQGNVVVAAASPEGYRELGRRRALAGSSLTWPSFAGNRILVRNLEELAAVALVPGASPQASGPIEAAAEPADHAFGRWLRQAAASEDPKAEVEAFLSRQESLPIVEGDLVHFLYRGEAEEVAISGSVVREGDFLPLNRLAGTDLFYRTLHLEPGGRWEYGFHVDFAGRTPDPKNPRTVPDLGGWGKRSEVVTEGYRLASHTAEPEGPRGRVETFELESQALGGKKEIQVWLPPSYSAGSRYPLLVVNDAKPWIDAGKLLNTLDNLVGKELQPMVVALVPSGEAWWEEGGGSRTADYARMLAEELVPRLRERYHLVPEASATALLGTRYFGLSSLYTALEHPEVFGKVALQSPNLGLGAADAVRERIRARRGQGLDIYLDWDRYGERNLDRGIDTTAEARELAALLDAHGYHRSGGEVLDSAGWSGWRNRTDRLLAHLFPGD